MLAEAGLGLELLQVFVVVDMLLGALFVHDPELAVDVGHGIGLTEGEHALDVALRWVGLLRLDEQRL